MSYTIVGVIGHIDHGKTSLVAALTGTDTDTHPEEKRRGITIDLGFATYTDGDHRFALIDAPGHQKYIGNLLAGVAKVDVGLLVVACDQGIQAQTLEHAAILRSLGIQKLIVAISRIDLADEATRAELSEELDWFLAEYGFSDVPRIAVSTVTGEGLKDLQQQLKQFAAEPREPSPQPFRMPIDRVFTIEGRGCVVAGTPWSGSVAIGDHATIVRTGHEVRIRELESHGENQQRTQWGVRTAINLVGTSAADVIRGDELIEPGSIQPRDRMIARLTLFSDASPLRLPATIQLHTGTTACEANLRGPRKIDAGQSAVVVIDTEQPLIVTFDQACLFRKPYPVGSFAGGRFLGSMRRAKGQLKRLHELGMRLADANDSIDRLKAWIDFTGDLAIDADWLRNQLSIEPTQIDSLIQQVAQDSAIHQVVDDRLVAQWMVDRLERSILTRLSKHAEKADDAWLPEQAIVGQGYPHASAATLRYVVNRLLKQKRLVRFRRMIAVASETTVLSKKQRARMDEILQRLQGERKPPTLKELAAEFDSPPATIASLGRFASQQQLVVDLGDGFIMDATVFRHLCKELQVLLEHNGQASVAEIRDHWQVTRKHAIPLLEYCDQAGITLREGDARKAGPELQTYIDPQPIEEQTLEQD